MDVGTDEIIYSTGHGGFYESFSFAIDFNSILRNFLTDNQKYKYADTGFFTIKLSKIQQNKMNDAIKKYNEQNKK